MDIKYTVEDNFMVQKDFDLLYQEMFGDFFPWFFHDSVASLEDKNKAHFFWTHIFFEQGRGITSPSYKFLEPILKKLKMKALIRIKGNMYSNQGKMEEHQIHTDYTFKHKGALFSLNTTNGYTMLGDKKKIQGVANRILIFDPSKPHCSSTCTDQNVRVNLIINYF